jgi:AmmeMemoRadiSam system protein A
MEAKMTAREEPKDSAPASRSWQPLTAEERACLLQLARQALSAGVNGQPMPQLAFNEFTARLREEGTAFVTLTYEGELRGCVGALEPYQPLAIDVCQHAIDAALHDFRFEPVQPAELEKIEIEISVLTPLQPLAYEDSQDLLKQLRPGVDGVVLIDGPRRATFLPQVWDKINDARIFLSQLCLKMGAYPDLWERKKVEVYTYQVEEFHE